MNVTKCPNCGGEVIYYHSSITNGDGTTIVVCKKKCQGWKVLQEIDRTKSNKEIQPTEKARRLIKAMYALLKHGG